MAFTPAHRAPGDFWNGSQTTLMQATDSTLGTALQLAVWEIFYVTSGTYSLSSGNFTGFSFAAGPHEPSLGGADADERSVPVKACRVSADARASRT